MGAFTSRVNVYLSYTSWNAKKNVMNMCQKGYGCVEL